LEKKDDLSGMRGKDYRSAWAWVHFMLHGPPEARQELVGFFGDIRAHTPPGRLSGRLNRRVPHLSRRFADHFRGWNR
jgi:hypothetical protein